MGDGVKKKKLKKVKSISSFREKMIAKQNEIDLELESGDLESDEELLLRRHQEVLGKQINKIDSVPEELADPT